MRKLASVPGAANEALAGFKSGPLETFTDLRDTETPAEPGLEVAQAGQHGQVDRAAAWPPRLRSLEVEPDVMSGNALFDACARAAFVARRR